MKIAYAWMNSLLIISSIFVSVAARGELQKNPRETNAFNFVRLLVMRLIYGFATMLGFEEPISEVAGGAFVPPGADDYGFADYDKDYDKDYDSY